MHPWSWWILGAEAFAIVAIAWRFRARLRACFTRDFVDRMLRTQLEPLAAYDQQLVVQSDLPTYYPQLTTKNSAAIDLLFEEAKSAYDVGRDRLKTIDGKAGTMIGIVTTGLGAVAILGDPTKTPYHGFWLVAGLIAFALAFAAALGSIVPRGGIYPDLSLYVLRGTLANASNAPRIKFELTGGWLDAAQRNDHDGRTKGRLLGVSAALLGVGLLALVLNFTTGKNPEKPSPTFRVLLETPAPSASALLGATAKP